MDPLKSTYMLLPNFRFRPGGDLQLGAIIGHDRKTKHPDPTNMLNKGAIVIPTGIETDETRDGKTWQGTVIDKSKGKVGLCANVASLPLGGGFEFGGGHDDSLLIECQKMKMSWFVPDQKYRLKAFGDEWVQQYTKPPLGDPAYLVTGLMLGEEATIDVKKGTLTTQKFNIGFDGTAIAIPINVGPEFEREKERSSGTTASPTKPFVLAYELIRLRRGFFGSSTTEAYTKHAVFDDNDEKDNEDLGRDWQVEPYTAQSQD